MTHVTTTSGWIPLERSSGDFRSFGVAVDSIELGNSIFFFNGSGFGLSHGGFIKALSGRLYRDSGSLAGFEAW